MSDEQNKDKKKKLLLILLLLLLVASVTLLNAYAHPGRTDSDGGHYNRSTGEYHYHHGYPAHDHIDGVCPYEKNEEETEVYTFDFNYDESKVYTFDYNYDDSKVYKFDYNYDNSKEDPYNDSETDSESESKTKIPWWYDLIDTVIHSHVFYIVMIIAVWELLKALFKLYKNHKY